MDQQWQVCELEESSNISLTLFERFSVVSVPESWILLIDGILVCFWPCVDPGKKIRCLHYPQDDEKCVYYKCRVLLDGAKFSTYKEAKEAERIAQNISSVFDSSVLLGSQNVENVCEGTMEFDVSDVDMEVSVNDEESDEIVGHDSFEYNEAMLNRPYRSKRTMAMAFEVENICGELLSNETTVPNETTVSDACDYSDFKFKGGNFLTSTVIEETDFSPIIKRVNVSDALSAISAVELKLSSFVNDVLNDLNKSKEMLRQMENDEGSCVEERKETTSNKGATVEGSSALKGNIHESFVDYQQPAANDEGRFPNGSQELNVQREKIEELSLKTQPTAVSVEDIYNEDASDNIQNINEIFTTQSMHVGDKLNVQRPEILSIECIPVTQNVPIHESVLAMHVGDKLNVQRPEILSIECIPAAQNVPVDVVTVSQSPSIPIHGSVLAPVESQPKTVIRLPIDSVEDHIKNEDLLDEDGFEEALINHLAPLVKENETNYMNRTILLVFTKDFFLEGVSWKKQSGRINMKHSSLLCCWKKSFRAKFDDDVDNDIFQKHFRRVKSAVRAGIKAELKRKLKEEASSKKMQQCKGKKPRVA